MHRYGDRIRYDAGSRREALVDTILSNGDWRPGPAASHDLMTVWGALPSVEVLQSNENDIVVWKDSTDGLFSLKTAWETIRAHENKVDWYAVVWFANNISKHSFLAWRVMMRRLPTQSRLCKLKILRMSQCCFCWNARETDEHLFFQCPFSSSIWKHVLSWIHPTRRRARPFYNECMWILQTYKSNKISSLVAKLVFCASLYQIWWERNQRRFGSTSRTASMILETIQWQVQTKI